MAVNSWTDLGFTMAVTWTVLCLRSSGSLSGAGYATRLPTRRLASSGLYRRSPVRAIAAHRCSASGISARIACTVNEAFGRRCSRGWREATHRHFFPVAAAAAMSSANMAKACETVTGM